MNCLSNDFSLELLLQKAMEQSAKDCGCAPEDFLKQENTVLFSKPLCGAKKYYTRPHFCHLVSYGNGTVAVADPQVYDFVCRYLKGCSYPFYAFDTPHLNLLSQEMQKYGKAVCFLAEYFLPDPKAQLITLPGLQIKWMYDQQIEELYSDKRFPMALSYRTDGNKKDRIAAVGFLDGELVGVAGVSDDCDTMWQIGIDVLPQFRGRGIAKALTSALTREVFAKGKIPFYCTAWSNIASKRNAVACGYRSSWVELSVKDIDFTEQMLG